MKLTWTRSQPSYPGYYFMRRSEYVNVNDAAIVDVTITRTGARFSTIGSTCDYIADGTEIWAGPVNPPANDQW